MASEVDQLVVKIAGDARALQEALKRAEKSVDNFATKVGKKMQKVGRGMQNVGKSMTKYITAPLMAIGGVGLHAFSKFEDNLVKSTAIMQVSTEELGRMKRAALEVGNTTTVSSQAAAEAFYFLASAGLNASETIEALPIVTNLAVAGNFDMAKATDLLTDAQSALGLATGSTAQKMEGMKRVSDVLTLANIKANASIEQYAIALTSKAGAALKMFNKSVEEGVAVLAVMADQGIKAELAGNNLNRMLLLLSQSSMRNAKAHKALGFSVYDNEQNMKSLADIVQNLEGVLAGATDAEKTMMLTQLGFDARVQASIVPLLGSSEAIRNHTKALEEAGGKTDEVAKKQLKSFSAQMKILWNQIRNTAMEIGKRLAPMIAWVGEKIRTGLEWWKKQSEAFKTTVFWIGVFVGALGPLLVAVGTLIVLVGGVTAALGAMATAFGFATIKAMAAAAATWLFNAAMMAAPFAGFAIGVAIVWKLSTALYEANSAVQDLNREMARREKLERKWQEMRASREKETDASIAAEEDPAIKIARLNKELEMVKKNTQGYKDGLSRANKVAKESEPTWKSLWQAGKSVHDVNMKTVEEQEERLEHSRDRAKELKEQLSAAKEEQAKMQALAAETGIEDQVQFQLVEEQQKELQKLNEELKLQEATVGMTASEIQIYKAEQQGANEKTMEALRVIQLENEKLQESINEKKKAEEASRKLAEAEQKLKEDVTKTTDKMQDSVDTWGMTSREAELYRLEMQGATKEELEMARALDKKLTELEKEKKAMEEHKALMKKGEALTKSLRTEEEKLADGEKELGEMLKAGAIDLETYERGMEKLHEKTKKDFKVKFKVSGVEAVIAGTADAAARLEEFRALSKKQEKDPPVDFKKRGKEIQQQGRIDSVAKGLAGPSEADKAIAKAAENEKKRQEAAAAEAQKLAEAEAAARDEELERLQQIQRDNQEVARTRKMLNEMDQAEQIKYFGQRMVNQMEESRANDEYGNVSKEFLMNNVDELRRIREEHEAKARAANPNLNGTKPKPPVDSKMTAMADRMATVNSQRGGIDGKTDESLKSMDSYLEEIKDSTGKLAESNLVVIEPANIGT